LLPLQVTMHVLARTAEGLKLHYLEQNN